MRALDKYNKERDRKLSNLIATCMKSMWLCYVAINISWLLITSVYGEYYKGLFSKCMGPMLITGGAYLIYYFLIVKKDRIIPKPVAYLLLNLYVILLLIHPSGLTMMDGVVFGVMAMYPIWTDRKWVIYQTWLFALILIARHAVLYMSEYQLFRYGQWLNPISMFCIGGMIYYNVQYVHTQTMLLSDATRMDAATGLYNHEYFYEELEKRMHVFAQTLEKEREEACFCLLIADIDNFKKVNDTYGHAFGDEVLLKLADIFKNYCGNKDFAARYGGEEFVLIVGGCHKKDAITRANTIRRRFADTVFTDASGGEHQFTVSLGVAEYDRPWNTASMFFDQSDQALYQAKNTGKNRVCSA